MLMLDAFDRPRSALREFLRTEAAGGILLILAALLAMILANSRWAEVFRKSARPSGPAVVAPLDQ